MNLTGIRALSRAFLSVCACSIFLTACKGSSSEATADSGSPRTQSPPASPGTSPQSPSAETGSGDSGQAPPASPQPQPAPTPAEPAPGASPAPSGAKLLFRSGFDGGSLSLLPPANCWGTGCWQDLVGLDSLTNFSWPGDVWGGGGKLLMLSSPVSTNAATMGDYMFNRLERVTAHDGRDSTALFQQITKNANGTASMGTSPMQNEFVFMPKRESGDMYVSYWMKLQPDLVEKMNNLPAGPGIAGGGTWRAIFALKTGGQTTWGEAADNGDYRIEAYVMTYGGGQPYWVLLGDANAGGGAPVVNEWRVENRNVRVPVGEWFKFEIFWHRSAGADGRVWMAIDGQVVADRRGANMGAWNMPINRVMAPLLYSGSAMPVYQWVDEVEVWDGFPSPGSNPPYAAH